jgi:hypothetical protein
MKRAIAILAIGTLIAFPSPGQGQEKLQKLEKLENKSDTLPSRDTTKVEVGKEIFSYEESGDEARVKIGKNEYRVVEKGNGVTVYKNNKEEGRDFGHNNRNKDRFHGHLGGLELGFNGFLTDFWSTTLDPADSYMDLNTGKSNNWNLIFPSLSIGMARHFGLVAAIGLNFNYYRFDGNNSITKDVNGVVGPLYPDPGITYSKSKLYTTYATLPILLEGQIPVQHGNTINIGAGVIGAVKLGSHTKVVYYTGGKEKAKDKDDFSLNVLRWGATARVGYSFFQVYGTCYFTQLFETGKGPELYPYEIGIAFTIND